MNRTEQRHQARLEHEANKLKIKGKQKRWVAENRKLSEYYDVRRQLT